MLSNLSQFEVSIENRLYKFVLSPDSPIQHAKEAGFQFLKFLGNIEDQIAASQPSTANPVEAPTEVATFVTVETQPVETSVTQG